MSNNNVKLHLVLKAPPEKVFRAFSDITAYTNWLPPYGYLCTAQQFEFKEGGKYKMTFTNFSTGHGHSFGGKILEIKPNEFIKYSDSFDDPNLQGEMTTAIAFKKVSAGTELDIVQEGIPEVIPADMCYLGWQECLDKLKRLVEPEIPDGM